MSVARFYLVLAVGLVFTSLASAILIETNAGRVGGFVVNDDGTSLKVRIPGPDGKDTYGEYPRANIKVIHELDVKRLEGLSRASPKAYRDYADELASHKADPEARYYAMRLYLIAARLAPAELGSSCLLRMSTLAGTPAEARRCRAMAFLLDPKADAKILDTEAAKPAPPSPLPARALDDFTKAMQLFRRGQIQMARETVQRAGVDKVFQMAPGKLDLTTFHQWCTDAACPRCREDGTVPCPVCSGKGVISNGFATARCSNCNGKKRVRCLDCGGTHVCDPLPDDILRVVLRCELWVIDQQGGGENAGRKDVADTQGWSTLLQSRELRPVMPLSLETMIPGVDPGRCRYRNRKWVED
jgi:hypothetical protein